MGLACRWLFLVLAACSLRRHGSFDVGTVGRPLMCDGGRSRWVSEVAGHTEIRYVRDVSQDLVVAQAAISRARAFLSARLSMPPEMSIPVIVWLVTEPTDHAGPGIASSISHELTPMDVYISSPTCSPAEERARFEKTIVHELAGEYLDRKAVTSGAGHSFYDAPSWFVQGYEEWLALSFIAPQDLAPEEVTARICRRSTGDVQLNGASLMVESEYTDGAALIAMLTTSEGRDSAVRILTSPATTFEQALIDEGWSVEEVRDKFLEFRAACAVPE